MKRWKPEYHEDYYFINDYMEISMHFWSNDSVDRKLFKNYNCLRTKAEAQEKLKKIKEILKGG